MRIAFTILSLAAALGATAPAATAFADVRCLYKECPVHGRQSCDHACAEVREWVPQPVPGGDAPPDGGTTTREKTEPRPAPVRTPDTAAIVYAGVLRQEAEQVRRTTEGRAEAEKTTRGKAQKLSREIGADGTAIEQAKAAKRSHTGANAFPDDPYHTPGKKVPEAVPAGGAAPVRGTAALQAEKERIESKIADTERQLAETDPAHVVRRAQLKQKISDLGAQRGMIVYEMQRAPSAAPASTATPSKGTR